MVRTVSLLVLVIVVVVAEQEVEDVSSHRIRSLPEVMSATRGNWTSLSEALDIFSVSNLVKNWAEGKYPVASQCQKDISRFVQGIRNKELWAIKADDASGRYTNGFLWGNTYFVGSASECSYIGYNSNTKEVKYNPGSSSISDIQKPDNTPKKVRGNSGPTGEFALLSDINDEPPYPLGFFMLKISINASFIATTRLIHLGVCLPFSCTAADVSAIAKFIPSEHARQYSTLLEVRDQHNRYDIYSDNVFWILFGVSVMVSVLLMCGTTYDLYLTKKYARKRTTAYDLEKHLKLEQLDNQKILNVTESTQINNNNEHENATRSSSPEFLKLTVWEELLLSFSIKANMKTICDPDVGRDTISTIHGLRAMSMGWVILGHTCIVVFKYSDNMEYRKVVEKEFLFQTITNGAFSVDTFFFMGGLLVSFLYFRTNAKGDLNKLTQGTQGLIAGMLKFVGFLLYRFCRLTAPYMFVLGVVQVTMKWFHSNSVFEPPTADHLNCPQYWWRNLLYINTMYPMDQMCMLWSWYLADDTQFYVIGAVILILATNHFKIAALISALLIVSSWITTGYIALVNNHMPNTDDPLALFDKIYDKPWTRLGPYFIGMAVGYFLYITDCKVRMSKITVILGWLLSGSIIFYLLFGLYETELSSYTAAAYSSLSHSFWALGLSWVIIACSTGYGGYINDLLSAPILYPFSRVTYCAYLVHPIVIRIMVMNMDSPLHLSKDSMMSTFFGQVVASYLLSFVVSLAFEAPVVSMLKILAPRKRNRIPQ